MTLNDVIQRMLEELTIGRVMGIAVMITLFNVVGWRRQNRPQNNKKLERAKALGHEVKAKRVRVWQDGDPARSPTALHHAEYKYEVDGVEYRYRYLGHQVPPAVITVYYLNNPRKGFSIIEDKKDLLLIPAFLFPILAGALVVYLLGG